MLSIIIQRLLPPYLNILRTKHSPVREEQGNLLCSSFVTVSLNTLSFYCVRFDPLHQRDEREYSPAGRLTL